MGQFIMFVHNNSSQGKCEWHVTGPLDLREAMEALTRVIEAEKRLKFEGDLKEFI